MTTDKRADKRADKWADKKIDKTRLEASREHRRLDTPRDLHRSRLRRPSVNTDAFGVFAEQFARCGSLDAFADGGDGNRDWRNDVR